MLWVFGGESCSQLVSCFSFGFLCFSLLRALFSRSLLSLLSFCCFVFLRFGRLLVGSFVLLCLFLRAPSLRSLLSSLFPLLFYVHFCSASCCGLLGFPPSSSVLLRRFLRAPSLRSLLSSVLCCLVFLAASFPSPSLLLLFLLVFSLCTSSLPLLCLLVFYSFWFSLRTFPLLFCCSVCLSVFFFCCLSVLPLSIFVSVSFWFLLLLCFQSLFFSPSFSLFSILFAVSTIFLSPSVHLSLLVYAFISLSACGPCLFSIDIDAGRP